MTALTLTRRDVTFAALGGALTLDVSWPETLLIFGLGALLGIGTLAFCDWLTRIVWGAPTPPEAAAVDRSRSYPHAVEALTQPSAPPTGDTP